MKKLHVILIFLCVNTFVFGQKNNSIKQQPEEKIKVNKEFDEQGNLVRYDSIYSYSSSNFNIDAQKIDSIMKHFFPNRASMPFEDGFNNLGFPDLLSQDFKNLDSIWEKILNRPQKLYDSIIKQPQ